MKSIATEFKNRLEEQQKAEAYTMTDSDRDAHEFLDKRRTELQEARRKKGVEEIWRAADKAYVPHSLDGATGKKVLQSEDELGWRSTYAEVTKQDDWAETSLPPNPYVKIQTALGIIVDQNPTAVFKPSKKKYERTNKLIESLYRRTWEVARSKSGVLKPMVLNMGKYGIGVGRTYPLNITRKVHDLINVKNGNKEWAEVDYTYYDDVYRESLSPWQCWFDDAGTVGNPWSYNDNLWYKDYDWDRFEEQFGHLPNFEYVKPTMRVLDSESHELKTPDGEGTVGKYVERVWFYENLARDHFIVETDSGIVLVNEPLPQRPRNKRLSLWAAPWTLRNDRDIEGIGIYEAMRNDYKLLAKIRNMTMDQLVLSIYKEWFYEGTDTQDGSGEMRTRPGVGRQVVNPKNITWNEIPGPGQEAWQALAYQEEKIEETTGITRGLQGEVVGKTAFEISQARESALKRIKTPLDNLTDALETEAYITCGLIEDIYSIPKIKLVGEDRYVERVELESYAGEEGNMPDHTTEYREIPVNVTTDKSGNYVTTPENETSFWTAVPEELRWEGAISIDGQSIVADSELLERQTSLELTNTLLPLLQMPPELSLKPATEILKVYDKDPEDWLPDIWLNPPAPVMPATPSEVPAEDPGAPAGSPPLFVRKEGAPEEAPPLT